MKLFILLYFVIFFNLSLSWFTGGRRRSSTCREYFGHESTNKLLLVSLEPVKSDLRVDFRSYIPSSAPIPSYKKIRFINHCCFIFPSTKTAWKTDMEFFGRRQRLLEIGERGSKIKHITIPSDLNERNILLYTKENRLSWSTCAQLEQLTKISCDSYWLKGCIVREHGPYTWYCNITQHISYTDDIPSITALQAGSDFMETRNPSMKTSC
ncbi:unnamed protein product [Rotaria sp. Silwood1]|nr:unnamed protein product [Rotaria sp. Silwood1]CAF1146407.1 unnamed protein product [Rotaria sp. Silwood1]CAF1151182.1 unnamed protein product [Rotaria sp. Silwood1]CAF3444623.1 unnamed protein product [Rotaria sp. Silwood1]CAF3452122.1 unnamed protein product [Rotaria sp. Silwood1]